MQRKIYVLITILLITSPVWADYKQALEKKDYAMAFEELKPLAENGDAEAQYYLGLMYSEGQGRPNNNEEALKWVTKSCRTGIYRGTICSRYGVSAWYGCGAKLC